MITFTLIDRILRLNCPELVIWFYPYGLILAVKRSR